MPKAAGLKLECLDAKYGDCFIIHYSSGGQQGKILLDGGPRGTYTATLKPRLEALATEDKGGIARFVLGVVTHIDDDHINGLIRLTDELAEQKANSQTQFVQFQMFWHNSFELLADPESKTRTDNPVTASVLNDFKTAVLPEFTDPRTQEILASVPQGQDLSRNLKVLGLSQNTPFDGLVMGPEKLQIPDGPKLHVVGPSSEQLNALKKEYARVLGGPVAPAVLAAYVDNTVANLSSIVFLLEYAGKRMLFTGDARGDHIIAYLKDGKLLDAKDTINVDVLKLPHHGSSRNLKREFFDQVLAKTYVISANGFYDNPDAETLDWLTDACKGRKCKVVFTNKPKMQTVEKQKTFDEALKRLKKAADVEIRDSKELSIFVEP